jgi:maltose-binding protein MalE
MKKTIALIAAVILALGLLAGCASTAATTESTASSAASGDAATAATTASGTIWADVDPERVYIVVNCLNNIEYFNAHKYRWEQCGEMFGVKVSFTGPADDT